MTITSTAAAHASQQYSGGPRFRCPCQRIPLSLSSASSAEYGDVASLAHRIRKAAKNQISSKSGERGGGGAESAVASGISDGGITPLHLSAQHGHPAAVSLLLAEGCDGDTGLPMPIKITGVRKDNQKYSKDDSGREGGNNSANTKYQLCGATPLHRAAFSGAISSMQVLLSWRRNNIYGDAGVLTNECGGVDLLAKDASFGDKRTPLHKAVAGGRPLAVQLLLNALRERQLLPDGLLVRDAFGLTPLELAKQFTSLDENELEQERCSVRRWDVVAGGTVADWETCQQLLGGSMTDISVATNSQVTIAQNVMMPEMPPSTDNNDCIDGKCRTIAWENAFRTALAKEVESTAKRNNSHSMQNKFATDATELPRETSPVVPITSTPIASVGRKCDLCGDLVTVLFRAKNQMLVCRPCRRK